MLTILKNNPEIYDHLNAMGDYFFGQLSKIVKENGYPYRINHTGPLGCLFFTDTDVKDYESAKTSDTQAYAAYCRHMLEHGIYLAPAQFEAVFLSSAHTKAMLDETLEAAQAYFKR